MNCRRVERLLSNHLEDRLSQRETGAVAAHLLDCRECRRRRDDIMAAETELLDLANPLPPPGIERRAVSLWSAEREARRRSWGSEGILPSLRARPVWRSPLSAALLVAVLLLAVLGLVLPASGNVSRGSRLPYLAAWRSVQVSQGLLGQGMV
jgi:anti-sigma factor RsiW